MENYLVSARKYRPSTFESVVGQKALTATLKNAVASGRLAHSYLFCGSRGVGKTSCARIFAKTINCEHRTPDGEACNECDSCRAFNSGTSMNIIELDAASNNGIDDMRALIEQVQVPPSTGRYRVFIVDEVHMLSTAAFNSFLKTLEEPPSYVVFILATTEKHKIIPTILSRCQIYDFHRITIDDMIDHLAWVASKENIQAERAALGVIARKADGAMRDALSIFDQVAASSRGSITYRSTIENLNVLDYETYTRLMETFLAGDVLQSWLIYKEIRDRGFDSQFFINGIAGYLRDLMAASDPATLSLLETGEDAKKALQQMAARCTPDFLYRAMCLCNDADLNYRAASNKQFLIELTLAKICQLLSPSPNKGSAGEGQLRPIAAASKSNPQPASPSPAPQKARPESASATPAPSSPPPVRPVETPSPPGIPAVAPAGARPATTLRVPKISIRMDAAGGVNGSRTPVSATQTSGNRNNAFSREMFDTAWDTYIATHPKAHILINTMRAGRPKELEGPAFKVVVENDMQREVLEQNKADILRTLRDSLQNDAVTFAVEINQGESDRYTLNDRELVNVMIQENPVLKKMIDDFSLKLG